MKKIIFVSLVLMAGFVDAASPLFRFQGRLTNNQGQPITGTPRVRFDIFSAASGGTAVWHTPDFQVVTTNAAGLFSTDIGPVDPALFAGADDLFLQVTVRATAGDQVLLPRQRFAYVPYAFNAVNSASADTAKGIVDQSISSLKIQEGAVQTIHIASDAVTSVQIKNGSVQSSDLAENSVVSSVIANESIRSVDLSTDAVRSENILDRGIDGSKIMAGSLTSTEIKNKSLKPENLEDDIITSEKIKDGEVNQADLESSLVNRMGIPSGMIAMFAKACPDGWTRFGLLDDRFPLGVPTYTGEPAGSWVVGGLTTAQSGDHTHNSPAHRHQAGSLTAPVYSIRGYRGADGSWNCKLDSTVVGTTEWTKVEIEMAGTHSHTVNSDGAWRPPHLGVVYCEKN